MQKLDLVISRSLQMASFMVALPAVTLSGVDSSLLICNRFWIQAINLGLLLISPSMITRPVARLFGQMKEATQFPLACSWL